MESDPTGIMGKAGAVNKPGLRVKPDWFKFPGWFQGVGAWRTRARRWKWGARRVR
ncbi:hypothetical protein MGWOODY_Smn297 [hydrothermal vent metagenome]|uniref:Uncharacterized protein n=1 Tax=hydrothermal vent metagenome TaxID=652676 RepID=A0A160TNQ2_9ZZZZ